MYTALACNRFEDFTRIKYNFWVLIRSSNHLLVRSIKCIQTISFVVSAPGLFIEKHWWLEIENLSSGPTLLLLSFAASWILKSTYSAPISYFRNFVRSSKKRCPVREFPGLLVYILSYLWVATPSREEKNFNVRYCGCSLTQVTFRIYSPVDKERNVSKCAWDRAVNRQVHWSGDQIVSDYHYVKSIFCLQCMKLIRALYSEAICSHCVA